jgi:hypothetical protein
MQICRYFIEIDKGRAIIRNGDGNPRFAPHDVALASDG